MKALVRPAIATAAGYRPSALWLVVVGLAVAGAFLPEAGVGGMNSTVYVSSHFEVREHEQPLKYVFNGNTRLARTSGSLGTINRLQRLRVFRGWNLCSLALTTTNALEQLAGIENAVRWDRTSQDWVAISAGEILPAGTVLWLDARTNSALSVAGAYVEPLVQTVGDQGNFVSAPGLEAGEFPPWISSAPVTAVYSYDSAAGRWLGLLEPPLVARSDFPEMLAPGSAAFVRTTAPAQLDAPPANLRIRYYHPDHLGSAAVVADAQGIVIEETTRYGFGHTRTTQRASGGSEPYQFTEKERDAESGLDYFETRFLVAGLGRFSRLDPLSGDLKPEWLLSPQRLNLYAYTQNRPVLFTDPTGMDRFARQPEDLQKVLRQSFDAGTLPCSKGKTVEGCTEGFSSREYAALTTVYQRMKARGLWQYVNRISEFSTAGELSITFSISDEKAFRNTLTGAGEGPFDYSRRGRFSEDIKVWNVFHPGSKSLREVSDTDSLHVSIYNQNKVTAHIDQFSPVDTGSGVFTSMDLSRGLRHQGREAGGPLLGDALLGVFGVPKSWSINPGLEIFPEQPEALNGPPALYYGAFSKRF